MSKKLIAVASAAALALSALVAIPAAGSVGPFAVTDTQATTKSVADTNGSTSDLAHTIPVPSADTVRHLSSDTTNNTLLVYVVTTPVEGAAVTVAATGGAKLITTAQNTAGNLTTASGTASLSGTSNTSGQYTFYAYTTSTTASTITVTSGSNSKVWYVKGVSAKANGYKLNFTTTSTATAPGGSITFTGTITDMFGNVMKDVADTDLVLDGIGGNLAAAIDKSADYDQNATTGVITFETDNRDTTGASAFSLKLGAGVKATKVTAFGSLVDTQFFTATGVDLAAQVTALTAQVAALQAIVDRKVTKKRYNTLARKWNAANPGSRVALKK